MTRGALREVDLPGSPPVVSAGRPPWWLMAVALLLGVLVTADLLSRGRLERMDLRMSEIVSDWGLKDSAAYPLVWVLTQVGGRVTILVVLAGLVGYLAWRRGTWVPALRVLLAVAVLTAGVYAIKYGTGRTAPAFPGSYFFHAEGASFPSGHVANAVLMWGVARWQAVQYGLSPTIQRTFWWLSIAGPLVTGVAMVSLDFHWVTDAVVGAAVGIVLLGVVHALDATVLSRWVYAHEGSRTT
ncbi:phosphatase PAP2 family protein [Blastococcus saxobsidens]|uniref:PAP2 superfamily protein n=1 Tax=Blastococcus saxobsidens TaxID=138336 RepID=A0A4Q7Y985_9ACTN|nr:phosphatase PAP2 family protein [Blastococcus saxobsidens]RZU32605.1 PAP2 superfamily protein [Blastococcus saxobsidens]